jgi:1-acyl-sn-glycerol-3-phosphate acyltransferase
MKEIHCVFIDRSNIRESVKSINEGVENLKNGYNMCIFPEGTRSKGDQVGEFKKGSMKLALKSNSLVVPVAINGTYKVLEANGWKIKPADVSVKILKPIDTQSISKEEKKDLSNIIRNSIIKNM